VIKIFQPALEVASFSELVERRVVAVLKDVGDASFWFFGELGLGHRVVDVARAASKKPPALVGAGGLMG
jgi:hypothetical protein